MTAATDRGRDGPAALWFLLARSGHLACGRWTFEDGALCCACGAVLYTYRDPPAATAPPAATPPPGTAGGGAQRPSGALPRGADRPAPSDGTGPPVALAVVALPSTHPEGDAADAAWRLLLADLDVADARAAASRLDRRRGRTTTAADLCAVTRAVREERLTREPPPLPDAGPDDPQRPRTELFALLAAIASGRCAGRPPAAPAAAPRTGPEDDVLRARALRVPCPWCRAAPGGPCATPRLRIPLTRSPAHPARLRAAGLAGPQQPRALHRPPHERNPHGR
ncbi:hypothetical protein [Streptomyces sp. NPDC001380]|uniref:zinc finger domain-containing protein n=1 Tax=Streptomyces sp. NPDC001380 TaxID=3364566 RepID=UPI0036D0C58E